MKQLAFCLLATLCGLLPSRAATLRPEQLKPGMKGYGLSVFNGTKPERFDVEVLGVLKNAFPKQDMILIRMSGANLEKHKVIAGMSGSPIYIDGKLIGALAYGWSFENEPLAGVTPIHNMLAELDRPAPARAGKNSGAASSLATAWMQQPITPLGDGYTPRPLLTPLSLGGFSPRTVELISKRLQQFGLLPIAAGGGSSDTSTELRQPWARIEPGSALGVELIRGDLNALAVGTATYVDRNKILAFGHPFFHGGTVAAPAVLAEVHTIMSSMAVSFKLATGVAEVGAMVGDWQSCIVADTKVKAPMIPLTVHAANRDTGHDEHYAMEIIDNDAISPFLVVIGIAEVISATSGSSQDTTVRVAINAELSDRSVRVADTFFSPMGGMLDIDALAPLVKMFSTPFGHPKIKRVEDNVDAALVRQTADVKRAYFSKSEVERGEHIPLNVVLKPFGQPEVTKTIEIEVPAATDSMHELVIVVMAGNNAPADIAPPDSLSDYLDAVQKEHRSTELVALVQSPTQGLQYRGKLLKKLPASVLGVLDDSTRSDIVNAADIQQLVLPTDWVLSGQALVRVPIRQE
jgi:hypothetical protein